MTAAKPPVRRRVESRLGWAVLCLAVLVAMEPAQVRAQNPPDGPSSGEQTQQAPPPQPAGPNIVVTVVGTTQLPGVEVPIDQVPAPVQVGTARDIQDSGALDIADFLNRRMSGVHVNETQNNPFQPDVNYRGYTASPLLGTPQGLSVYMDGVRLNQPFGEVVGWDLVPRIAIATTTLMPGSNPLFGLNTLGGALSLQTKDGRSARGTTIQATYGSDVRRALDFEHGGYAPRSGVHWYLAGSLFGESGWRDDSPSDVRQVFAKVGRAKPNHDVIATFGYANNSLTGNGLQDRQLLEHDYDSIYTKPDTTDDRAVIVSLSSRHQLNPRAFVQTNAYYRDIRTDTINGDVNEASLGQPEGQCLKGVPADDPGELCNGLINRTHLVQHNGGASGQLTRRGSFGSHQNQLTVGAAFDRSTVGFAQSTEIGSLNSDRSVTGLGVFADGVTGGEIDGEPFDARVDLDGSVATWSAFATDTLPLGARGHATLSGRYNRTSIDNHDRIDPGGGPGSLDGRHTFGRFNPAAGVTFTAGHGLNVYAGYSEGSRAPTSIELGCADPEHPCKLPNAMAGDPPLNQVVTRTLEAGVRTTQGRVLWNAGVFRAENRDDILFVTSEQTGFGYFKNFGQTRRQGLELGLETRLARATFGAGYTFLRATFESEETVNGEGNSTNSAALDGMPGLEGTITIAPGDRLPFIPQHILKAFGNVTLTPRLAVDVDLIASGGSIARGNENNAHEPDGTYYLGPGSTDAYAVVNLGARYRMTHRVQVIGQINNLFDRQYATAAQLGPAAFLPDGRFVAQPFPPVDGEFPIRHTTFFAPGAPRRAWVGMRVRF